VGGWDYRHENGLFLVPVEARYGSMEVHCALPSSRNSTIQKAFLESLLPFPTSPLFHPVVLNSFPNKLYYYFYYKKEKAFFGLLKNFF
jgi:hypothetical protein